MSSWFLLGAYKNIAKQGFEKFSQFIVFYELAHLLVRNLFSVVSKILAD